MRHITLIPIALTLAAALAGCQGDTIHECPDPVADPVVVVEEEETPAPAPVVMKPVEPSKMPSWNQWLPAPNFPGVERGGSFAHDVGMMWDGIRFEGKFYRQDAMAPVVLGAAGWATATAEQRKTIAEQYCRGLLDWDVVWDIEHTPWEASKADRFTPATASVRADGTIVFTAWSDETFVGMRPPVATEYRKFEAVFALDGTLTVTVVETYDAPRERS